MKKNLIIAFLLGAIAAKSGFAQYAWDQVVLIGRGSFAPTSTVSVGTAASTALVSVNNKRADLTCRNNSSFTIYIGTNAAGTTLTGVGFPILTNETFGIGSFTDAIYAIASGGTADVRCWDGQTR